MMRKTDEIAWCGFLSEVLKAWRDKDTLDDVAARMKVKKSRVYRALCWFRREGLAVLVETQPLRFCHRNVFKLDKERAALAIERRERIARGEEAPPPAAWPGLEAAMAGIARQRCAVSRSRRGPR